METEEQYPGPIHALAKMAGQCLEFSSYDEGYEQAGTVFGHVQGQEQGIQPSSESQVQQQKFDPSAGGKMDKGQGHQPLKLRTKSLDFDSRPMRTTYPAARHHRFREDHAPGASTGGKSDPGSQYTPRTSVESKELLLNPKIPRGPYTAEGCTKIAEFLAHAPWEEQREGLITTQSKLRNLLNTHNLVCHLLTEKLESLPKEEIPTAESKILLQIHRNIQYSVLRDWSQEWFQPETNTAGLDDIVSEVALFESQRLGFLQLKITLLGLNDIPSNTREMEI